MKGRIKLSPKALEVVEKIIRVTPRKEAKVGRLMVEACRERTKQKNKEIKYSLAHINHKPIVDYKEA